MKRLFSWKLGLLVSAALCLLVVGGIVWFWKKRPPVRQEPKHYPHEHLQTSALEPNAQLTKVEYTLRDGETLAEVARLRYGHQNYYRVIKLYNHLPDEGQVASDHTLRLPEMSAILAEEGVTRVAAQEVTLILCSRAKYDRVVKQLWTLRSESSDNPQVPEDVRRELLEAADDLEQATEGLKQTRPEVTGVPKHMINQLEQNTATIHDLAAGKHSDPEGYDIDMVQQRYALALAYAIIWARDGFK